MRQAPCNKCRSGAQAQGDSWCLGCSAQEASAQLLKKRWNNPGLRAVAEETLLTSARLVKAFHNLDNNLITPAALDKSPLAAPKVRSERPRSRTPRRDERSPLRRHPPQESRSHPSAEEEDKRQPAKESRARPAAEDEEYTYEEDTEEEEEIPAVPEKEEERADPPRREVKEESRGSERPPEPEKPPRASQEEPESHKREKKKKKKKNKRGGTRHQRHHRENYQPLKASHRKYPQSELRLSRSLDEGLSRRG